MATKKPAAKIAAEPTEAKPKVTGATSGVSATGKVGKAARLAAAAANTGGDLPGWRNPDAKYAETDNSIDARMWRLNQDHARMGSR